jgi:uncharacterized membrane protein
VDDAVTAWRAFCDRMAALGERLLTDEFPADVDGGHVDGVRHLVEQVVLFLGWSVLHADPRRPAFQRHNDLVGRWGGPNVDNVYRHARVDPSLRYRIRGRMHGCDDWVLAVRAGFMHMPAWGTLRTITASSLGVGRGDDFEVVLDDLPDGAVMVSVREYYVEWRAEEPATFTIECLDDVGPGVSAGGPGTTDVAAQLRDAAHHVERSVTYWNDYLREARAGQGDNVFTPPVVVGKGLSMARNAYCFWDLADGDALVVECDVPSARYWSFQLYNLGWFEAFDLDDRIVSVNNAQAALSDDTERVEVVVSASDPGVRNWLDTGGRRHGLLMLRWFWPDEDAPPPSPSTRVVSAASLSGPVDTEARRAERRARLDHLSWRFRT